MTNPSSTASRFDATMAYYHQFRPTYPAPLIEQINKHVLLKDKVVADIGAGTGLLTQKIAPICKQLHVIEPNQKMLNFCQEKMSSFSNISYLNTHAENTSLAAQSIDSIFCAQAFHWFNPTNTKQEFKRILKPNAWVILLWNMRDNSSPLMQAYEELLVTYGTDYNQVKAENIEDKDIEAFAGTRPIKITEHHSQTFDWEGFKGRLLSTSYSPKQGDDNFEAMLSKAAQVFEQHQQQSKIAFDYQAVAYLFKL